MMVNIDMTRSRIAKSMTRSVTECRIWLSTGQGSQEMVDLLRGDPGMVLIAKLTEVVMAHIGHETEVTADSKSARSKAMRTVSKLVGG